MNGNRFQWPKHLYSSLGQHYRYIRFLLKSASNTLQTSQIFKYGRSLLEKVSDTPIYIITMARISPFEKNALSFPFCIAAPPDAFTACLACENNYCMRTCIPQTRPVYFNLIKTSGLDILHFVWLISL